MRSSEEGICFARIRVLRACLYVVSQRPHSAFAVAANHYAGRPRFSEKSNIFTDLIVLTFVKTPEMNAAAK